MKPLAVSLNRERLLTCVTLKLVRELLIPPSTPLRGADQTANNRKILAIDNNVTVLVVGVAFLLFTTIYDSMCVHSVGDSTSTTSLSLNSISTHVQGTFYTPSKLGDLKPMYPNSYHGVLNYILNSRQ